jgi:membrane protease YdiL (CAAX protease family)
MLIIPPLSFLVLTILASLAIGFAARGDPEAIESGITGSIPYVLLLTQAVMLFFLWRFMTADGMILADVGWRVPQGRQPGTELLIAVGAAIPLVLLNQFVLLPVTEWLQVNVGDYVPAGTVGETLGATAIVTAVSAVLLAPFVEGSIYRGYVSQRLRTMLGPIAAFLIVMVFFGLLHWAQGF